MASTTGSVAVPNLSTTPSEVISLVAKDQDA
jgi:hypothetical protein